MSKRSLSLQLVDSPSLGMKVGIAAGKQLRRGSELPAAELRRGSLMPPKSQNKLRKGKRDGTPDKPTTPSASGEGTLEDGRPGSAKNIIMNEEIEKLAIKSHDLQKLREPRPPSDKKRASPVTHQVVVRKLKPASELEKPVPKTVTVARPAPADAPLKPYDYTGGAGPRFDMQGNLVPHSILGSVEEFKRQALLRGDLPAELAVVSETERQRPPSVKYEKKKQTATSFPKQESVEESNALKNWQRRMMERRKQQGYLSKLLDKPTAELVMNQADSYRKTQELRYILDRTIPTMDYGKGYRIGSEFWKQRERIGDDLGGIHMTLSQTEKGYPPPIEHIGVPQTVLKEKGTFFTAPKTPLHKPWHKTPFLHERKAQLQTVIDELDPHQPDLEVLEIVGKSEPATVPTWKSITGGTEDKENEILSEGGMTETEEQRQEFAELENLDPLRDHPDVHLPPVFGPSLTFAGQVASWTGDSHSYNDQLGLEARVTFETYAGQRHTSLLEIVNNGTTAIYFDWKKIHKDNPFNMPTPKVQRFYFNTSGGVILPGDTMRFPFVFKSPNAGVFTEQWQFQTRPVVCGGAALVVTLRGVALQEDKYEKERSLVEHALSQKQAETIVRQVLYDLLEGIRSPERPRSAVDAYITEGEIFSRRNQELFFNHETLTELRQLHKELFPEPEPPEPPEPGQEPPEEPPELPPIPEWDLSVSSLKEMIMEMDEDDERKQELLIRLNKAVMSISFPQFTPVQQQMYAAGYQLLGETCDNLVGQSMWLRSILGMPDKETEEVLEESATDSRKPAKASKPDAKEKKGGKESKSAKGTAKEGGRDSKTGKTTPGGKRPSTREKTPPASGHQSPVASDIDPIMNGKYRDKLYTQTYMLVSDMISKMAEVFETIQMEEGGPKLPDLF